MFGEGTAWGRAHISDMANQHIPEAELGADSLEFQQFTH